MKRNILIVATVVFSFASVAAQVGRDTKPPAAAAAQQGTATISGTVVSADLGRPVRRATVTAIGSAGDVRTVRTAQTEDNGTFAFINLQPGEYFVSANKGGFVESIYGQRQPGSGRLGTPIRLSAGQQLKELNVALARGGVLTGVVLDEVGDPAFGITVRAYKWVMKSGERSLAETASGVTDDRGIYRIPALLPGEYVAGVLPAAGEMMSIRLNGLTEYVKVIGAVENRYEISMDTPVAARVRDGGGGAGPPKTGFARSFYPGVGQAGVASAITLGPGEERPGVDFSLQVVPIARVSGTVMSPTGPVSGASVQLVDSSQPPGFGVRTARTSNGGGFVFDAVTPGQYALTTRAPQKGAPQLEAGAREAVEFLAKAADNLKAAQVGSAINAASLMWAATEIAVDGRDQADVQLTLQPGATVAGRVVIDTGAEVAYSRMAVGLAPIGSQKNELGIVGPAAVDAAGRFTIKGVSPGRYRLTVMGGMPGGHSLASAVFGGQDILDIPLEMTGAPGPADGLVTLTTKTTELTGTIQDAAGQPASAVTVIVFPSDERFWAPESRRIQGVRPATDGRYQVRNLPPGDYRLVVVSDVEPGRWFDPAFLRQLGGFASVTLGNGGRVVQDFRVK